MDLFLKVPTFCVQLKTPSKGKFIPNPRFEPCSEQTACQYFRDSFIVEKPKYVSINYKFKLYCKRRLYKSVLISVSTLVSPFVQVFNLFFADRLGRRKVILLVSIFGFAGTLLSVFGNSLVMLGFGFTFILIYCNSFYALNYIFINELLVDPLRSKATGIKTFSFAVGLLSGFLKKANLKFLP